ncbi:MAG TPA: DUF4124 domain-containing protein [Rhodanobacteraceae bacterium]|nr:DUF4124 domain-containing protein [Rhodanobacteraceae bacterium]
MLLSSVAPSFAASVFKCTDAQGRVAFQDRPCRTGQTQQRMHLPAVPAPAAAASAREPTTPAPTPAPATAALPAPLPARIPPPDFYLCTRYDGSRYASDSGTPGRVAVPLGVLGIPGRSLAQAYGGRDSIGVSAPELGMQGHVPAARVPFGGGYTWIADECHHADPAEACTWLRHQLDDTETRLRHAFSDEEAGLEQKDRTLRERLRGC